VGEAMSALTLPRRGRGRLTGIAENDYQAKLRAFCQAILQIRSTLDFEISARGWCYILEDHGLKKGDFDSAETLIADWSGGNVGSGKEYCATGPRCRIGSRTWRNMFGILLVPNDRR
jgi:hypothetical protein